MISRVCEEFHCTPLEAVDQPYDLSMAIIELRGYQRAKDLLEQTEDFDKLPKAVQDSPSMNAVWDSLGTITADVMNRRAERFRAKQKAKA